MFVGHLAVALGAKKIEPRLPLAALTAAVFGLDMLWPVFLLAGLETVRIDPGNTRFTPLDFVSYPWSHSLLMSAVWALAAGLASAAWFRSSRAGGVIALGVVSHWILDWITHRPDLPLWPGGPMTGLGLWNSIPGTLLVEGALYAAGIAMYLRATAARDAIGRWGFWALVAVTVIAWVGGPASPPPGATPLAVASLVISLVFLVWVIWIERHRRAVRP